jgi:hypothetical protein
VRGQEDGRPTLAQPVDQLVHVTGSDGIEPRGRLIEKQHLGVAQQRPCQRHALTESFRQGTAQVGGPIAQVHGAEGACDPGRRVDNFIEVGEAPQVVGHAQAQVQPR